MEPENINPELKERLTNAKSIEELREIAVEAGCVLSDEELSEVAGGSQGRICPRDYSCMTLRLEPGPPIVRDHPRFGTDGATDLLWNTEPLYDNENAGESSTRVGDAPAGVLVIFAFCGTVFGRAVPAPLKALRPPPSFTAYVWRSLMPAGMKGVELLRFQHHWWSRFRRYPGS